jgi:hypothetical protein
MSRVAAVRLLVVLLEPGDMREKFVFRCPAGQVKAEHLESPLCGLSTGPQAYQQTGDEGDIGLNLNALLALTEEVPAAEDALEPTEKEFHGPTVTVSECYQISRQIQPVRGEEKSLWLAESVTLSIGHLDQMNRVLPVRL